MQHSTQLTDLHLGNTWLTIGSFDGVHQGHQGLIRHLVTKAHSNDAQAAVLTFHPHPAIVLRGKNDPFYLTSLDEKLELIESLGVDYCITMEFNLTIASFTAQYFIQLLSQHMVLKKLIVGQGFALGRGRTGDIGTLTRIGENVGYTVEVIDPVEKDGVITSSSHIRKLISDGEVDLAKRFLGRDYSITGIISHGDGRGRTLGFPTANIAIPQLRLLPKAGVYACKTLINGKSYPSVANIGFRPTFNLPDPALHLEVHILDFDEDIYGQLVNIEFIKYLRGEVKFLSIEQLIEQIHKDIKTAREILL
jgi:riboflavin kinase/FMN adenylyltransferase